MWVTFVLLLTTVPKTCFQDNFLSLFNFVNRSNAKNKTLPIKIMSQATDSKTYGENIFYSLGNFVAAR